MDKKAEWALVGAAWFLALSVAGLGWLAWSHFGPRPDPAKAFVVQTDGRARCPVTGEWVQAVSTTPQVDYQGQIYYFSSDKNADGQDARTRFLMAPESYLHPAAAPR